LYEVLTHTGVVTVTEDHSLLRPDSTELTTNDIIVGKTKLMTKKLPIIDVENYYIGGKLITPKEAYGMGAFYADGSCGTYDCKRGKKSSWAINKSNLDFLENCKKSLSDFIPNISFKILDTMKSSHVYKLVATGDVKNFVNLWRTEFYNYEKLKRVPNGILSASVEVREAFFQGYYDGDGDKQKGQCRFDNKGKIGSAGLYYLVSSLGYSASINNRKDKPGIYRITCTKKLQRKDPGVVKKILPIEYNEDIYVYDLETENHHFAAGVGQLIVHNTDSTYVQFKDITNATKLWDHCLAIEEEISKLFPPPMFMAFEEVIYWQFLILTKKRYMYKSCGRDGIVNQKIGKKGVLLARRDNSLFIRNIYEETVEMIFQKLPWDEILFVLLTRFNELCSAKFCLKDFVVSKSVGDVADYKIRELSDDPKKRAKRLKDLNCSVEEYESRCLPAHVQLAEKMRARGIRVDVGSRLEYVVTTNAGIKAKLFDKLENQEYVKEHNGALNIEYLYYLKLLGNSLDQILNIVYKRDKFSLNQYKLRVKKQAYCKSIEELFSPEIILYDSEPEIIFDD
jgi:hypothetical protein